MDYLRTLGSAAVSTLVQKSGLNLPFTLGQKVHAFENKSIWTLYEATKRDDGSSVSVFEFDANAAGKRNVFPLAKNMLRKLRTVRHPDVLKYMDAVETETTIHIMTERVKPLSSALQAWSTESAREREDWLLWGLHRVSVALTFLNDPCASTHGNICIDTIFISPSGEWKIGGFELLSSPKDEAAVLYTMGGLLPSTSAHSSPEIKKSGWSVLKEHHPSVADAYALGLLLHSAFNPTHALPATAQPPHSPPTASSRGAIPNSVFPSFKKLLNPNPKARMSAQVFLDVGMADSTGFFANNPLVKVCLGLDNFNLASDGEKASFLRALNDGASSFPPEFASYRVLPSLVSALEFGGASAAAIIPLFIRLGKNVSGEEYASVILVPLVKLFANPDRGTRMALLDQLPEYADRLDKKTVTDKIWPHLQSGFSDTVPVIREATVKSIILLSSKLNDRILNNDLLRHLAKMQGDTEASIRTNTCILLGRLGPSLGYNTKRKVLVPAFGRALKDPFVHARVAGLMAFMATIECFEIAELAARVVPTISGSMVDNEKLVRDQAFKAVELFVKKLEEHAATMPETAILEEGGPANPFAASSVPGQATIANSAASAAGALAGWAISSLGKKLAPADLQSAITSTLPANGLPVRPSPLPSPLSTLSSPIVARVPAPAKARGMQLGASKVPASVLAAELAEEAAAAAAGADGADAWGDGDLMDVNADTDDWTAFESAPASSYNLSTTAKSARVSSTGSGLGFSNPADDADDDADEWGAIDPSATVSSSSPVNEAILWGAPAPEPALPPAPSRTSSIRGAAARPGVSLNGGLNGRSRPTAVTPSTSSRLSTPTPASPALTAPDDGSRATSPAHATSGLSKEEKAAEMARRKEERKQRIAQLKEQKEQKKGAGKA